MSSVITLPVTEDDPATPTFQITSAGAPLDLTSLTVTALIKKSESVADDAVGVYTLTADSGLTVIDAAQGKVRLTIPAEVVSTPGWWFYKILVAAGDAPPRVAIYGRLPVADA